MLLITASSSIATGLSLSLSATSTTTTIVVRTTIYVPSTPITLTVPTIITTTTTSPCPLNVGSFEVMSSKSTYFVGENIVISWSGFGGAFVTNGILRFVGPYGPKTYPLNLNDLAAGQFVVGPILARDIGSWTATLIVLDPLGCPLAIGSTQFQATTF